jgi:hypothetical protein
VIAVAVIRVACRNPRTAVHIQDHAPGTTAHSNTCQVIRDLIRRDPRLGPYAAVSFSSTQSTLTLNLNQPIRDWLPTEASLGGPSEEERAQRAQEMWDALPSLTGSFREEDVIPREAAQLSEEEIARFRAAISPPPLIRQAPGTVSPAERSRLQGEIRDPVTGAWSRRPSPVKKEKKAAPPAPKSAIERVVADEDDS